MMMATQTDWRFKDENFQKRHFLLSSFVRLKYNLTRDVYEFCDFTISQGYNAPLDDLNKVDIDIKNRFHQYLKEVKGY